MEEASFYLSPDGNSFIDFDAFYHRIMSAGNIDKQEKEDALWKWMDAFPASLSNVLSSKDFQDYFAWERKWVEDQTAIFGQKLLQVQKLLNFCESLHQAQPRKIDIILNPIKCVYSADYYFIQNRFVFSSGTLNEVSIVHEYLHPIVHPYISNHQKEILRINNHFPQLDSSYSLSGDSNGQLNAFEEFTVRALTDSILSNHFPSSIDGYIDGYIEQLIHTIQKSHRDVR